MIKKYLILISLLFGMFVVSFGQLVKPVLWNLEQKPTQKGEIDLVFKAKIEPGWHLYSTDLPGGGPIKTTFTFTPDKSNYQTVGKIIEKTTSTKEHDKIFNMDLAFFSKEAIFIQKIKLLSNQSFELKGTIEYQSCNDETCTLDDYDFSFKIVVSEAAAIPLKKEVIAKNNAARSENAVDSIKNQVITNKPAV